MEAERALRAIRFRLHLLKATIGIAFETIRYMLNAGRV
ncbi:hypothetical protein SAMN06265361_102351 [Laceyella tengchongensis]|uniref:Uncharacterized protein n=1 Tax=Laceyella tengchongensis TaxID=574699 RepID=A0AA46AEH1_9BACL|nr:hypothetical protein SAMN06265361_102351 [Laceyella tengchongensis]